MEATEALRRLIDAIVMTPADGALRTELKGNLAAMLGATVQSKRAPKTEALSLQVSMVAGPATVNTDRALRGRRVSPEPCGAHCVQPCAVHRRSFVAHE